MHHRETLIQSVVNHQSRCLGPSKLLLPWSVSVFYLYHGVRAQGSVVLDRYPRSGTIKRVSIWPCLKTFEDCTPSCQVRFGNSVPRPSSLVRPYFCLRLSFLLALGSAFMSFSFPYVSAVDNVVPVLYLFCRDGRSSNTGVFG